MHEAHSVTGAEVIFGTNDVGLFAQSSAKSRQLLKKRQSEDRQHFSVHLMSKKGSDAGNCRS